MSDTLLPYYNRELNAIRALGADFARAHPKIAGRLRLTEEAVDDPHVARLLEGVAFLAARVHHRLDDEFPELTDALLGVLYPHYLAPVPSSAIVQFACQSNVKVPISVPRGRMLEAEPLRGENCRFRTAFPLTLWPIEVEAVRLSGIPLAAPANPQAAGALSVLRISLRCSDAEMTFGALGIERLRFFLRAATNVSMPLYELICGHTMSVAYADGPSDPNPVILPATAISPAGFAADEALIPWPARSFSGFRLLTEYFTLPEKFLFVDFERMEAKTMAAAGNKLDIFVYLDRAVPELERAIGNDIMALGCTPVVNLFPHRCEPVPLSHTTTEYRLEPDVRRPGALEVWSVEQVRETRGDGTFRPWQPFYRIGHGDSGTGPASGFYTVARRASSSLRGTDVFLQPFDPAFSADSPSDAVLSVDTLCLNRDLPAELPFGGGHPRLHLVETMASVTKVSCLTAPTSTLRAPTRSSGFWPLISHLSLGHLSVVGGDDAAATIREVLRLYDLRGNDETRAAIEGLVGVSSRPGASRVQGARIGAFARGLDVTLEWDARAWGVGGLYLLASVLDRFLALHATVNSFVRTTCVLRGRPGTVARWPARAGARVLL